MESIITRGPAELCNADGSNLGYTTSSCGYDGPCLASTPVRKIMKLSLFCATKEFLAFVLPSEPMSVTS
eukprot:CAMPEP_0172849180 /NCGR_PEP_ID=MMETSP1075-20121228/46272_1 /TAXON_ID=2916 /ORGANISM="Ceratium fusus, Strain PA161109" /LENGTH=68 /DNA_ID=CAMNT_0013694711 /DNA_START=27 /DNA_END=233 /DNA_ORIENTATION=-